MLKEEYITKIKKEKQEKQPNSLLLYGYKIYSQSDEDGILDEIFKRIGVTNKIFIEFGVGDGLENNTLALLFQNWHGLWIDASHKNTNKILRGLKKTIAQGVLTVINSFITKDNINQLIASTIKDKEIDLLSVDIDGNDFHIISAINCISPRVIVVEYNAKYPPPVEYCMDYNPNHKWDQTDCFGASLKFLEVNLAKINFVLVGCSVSGLNAFFIRKDLISEQFSGPFSAENHYEPPRYFLSKWMVGHPPSYKTLENSVLINFN